MKKRWTSLGRYFFFSWKGRENLLSMHFFIRSKKLKFAYEFFLKYEWILLFQSRRQRGKKPKKKRKTESEVDLCMICLTKRVKENVIKQAQILSSSIRNLLSLLRERREHGDPAVAQLVCRTKEQTIREVLWARKKRITNSYNLSQCIYN